jgi:hypothetical protein
MILGGYYIIWEDIGRILYKIMNKGRIGRIGRIFELINIKKIKKIKKIIKKLYL